MNTKKKSGNYFFVLIALLVFPLLFSCSSKQEKQSVQKQDVIYYCTMHPEVESNVPGKCPKCHMQLVIKADVQNVLTSPNEQVLSSQSTVKLSINKAGQANKLQGYIGIDKDRNQTVAARFGGRIEKLYVTHNLQYVNKGDKIMELYSPEINTYQEEHLFLINSKAGETLIKQSREKLKLLGITSGQIEQLEKKEKITASISVFSPVSGYVFFDEENTSTMESAKQNTAVMPGMNMQTTSSKTFASAPASVLREGMYINAGQSLFTVNDLKSVWAIVSATSENFSSLKEGTPVQVHSELFSDKTFTGKVVLQEPVFEEKEQRFTQLRVALNNSDGQLKINSLVTVNIKTNQNSTPVLPASAVYQTGMGAIVWLKTGQTKSGQSIFKVKRVVTGTKAGGMISILEGLSETDEVAKEAGLMADSETIL